MRESSSASFMAGRHGVDAVGDDDVSYRRPAFESWRPRSNIAMPWYCRVVDEIDIYGAPYALRGGDDVISLIISSCHRRPIRRRCRSRRGEAPLGYHCTAPAAFALCTPSSRMKPDIFGHVDSRRHAYSRRRAVASEVGVSAPGVSCAGDSRRWHMLLRYAALFMPYPPPEDHVALVINLLE